MASDLFTDLRAKVSANAERGVIVTTAQASTEPADFPLAMTRGATWSLFVAWYHASTSPVDLSSGYEATLVIYGLDPATPYVTMTQATEITLIDTGMTIVQTVAEIAAYTWGPRARYRLTVTDLGVPRVYPLMGGFITVS